MRKNIFVKQANINDCAVCCLASIIKYYGGYYNLEKLRQIMYDYVDGKRPTIKTVMIEEFAKELDNILNLYKPKKISIIGPKQEE